MVDVVSMTTANPLYRFEFQHVNSLMTPEIIADIPCSVLDTLQTHPWRHEDSKEASERQHGPKSKTEATACGLWVRPQA